MNTCKIKINIRGLNKFSSQIAAQHRLKTTAPEPRGASSCAVWLLQHWPSLDSLHYTPKNCKLSLTPQLPHGIIAVICCKINFCINVSCGVCITPPFSEWKWARNQSIEGSLSQQQNILLTILLQDTITYTIMLMGVQSAPWLNEMTVWSLMSLLPPITLGCPPQDTLPGLQLSWLSS